MNYAESTNSFLEFDAYIIPSNELEPNIFRPLMKTSDNILYDNMMLSDNMIHLITFCMIT
jgi:hypothetical protein